LNIKSSGKAVLAFLPEDQANRIVEMEGLPAHTKHSITDAESLRRDLAAIRKRGYATDMEEFRDGISAISAPVFNSASRVVGALTVVAPAFRMTKEKVPIYGKKCVDTAARLSAMIPL